MASFDGALLTAASEGNLSSLQDLVNRQNADVNVQGQMNRTPLHLAALYGRMEAVMFLVESGAKMNMQASSGEAVLNGHTNVAEYLLVEGADWKIQNNIGKKPVDYARKRQMKKLFSDAEQGLFNQEEEEEDREANQFPKKRKGLQMDPKMMEELLGAGYPRGDILDSILSLEEKGDPVNLASMMRDLEGKKEKSENKKEEEPEDSLCKICFEGPLNSVLVPCGHVAACIECAEGLKNCPMCRTKISQVIRTFKA